MISNRHRSVRNGFILFFTYLLLLAAVVFTIEIIFIFFGVGDIFFPWIHKFFALFQHFWH
jgi:hypothetical protein